MQRLEATNRSEKQLLGNLNEKKADLYKQGKSTADIDKQISKVSTNISVRTGLIEGIQKSLAPSSSSGSPQSSQSATPGSSKSTKASVPSIAEQAENLNALKFTSGTGSESSFKELQGDFQQRVLAAAEEYHNMTGKSLQINSANRDPEDQQRLYDATVKAGTPGIGPSGMPVGKPGRSLHERGEAVDIQQGKTGDKDAINALNKQGLIQAVPKDPVHFQLGGRDGGLFTGPNSGYPVELHGREAVVPLPNPDSIVKVEDNTSANKDPLSTVMSTNSQSSGTVDNSILADLMQMLSDKLDDVIDTLEDGNNTSSKILQYSQV